MREFNWCDFEWDPRVFPDPEGMLAAAEGAGLHICVWINPYIAQRSPLFAEGKATGYLLRRPDGNVWQWDLWQPGMALVDFTNPAARDWYASQAARRCSRRASTASRPTSANASRPDVVYSTARTRSGCTTTTRTSTTGPSSTCCASTAARARRCVFARSATAGGQQFPVHWGGDCESTYESMAESLRGGLSLGLSGFGFWSHDIGGFEGTPSPALFKRWVAFGLLSSHSRLHGSPSYRVPWLFDEEAVDVLRLFTRLKLRLMPYLYEAAAQRRTPRASR